MSRYYLSNTLFYDYDKKCHFIEIEESDIEMNIDGEEIPKNKRIYCEPVIDDNFTKVFSDYGWINLDYLWDIEFGEKWLMLECGADGDCLFHSISEALNLNTIYNLNEENEENMHLQDIQSLRNLVSSKIDETNFSMILESYKLEEEMGEFQGDWSPNEISSIEELQAEIVKCNDNFWGDHIIIQLLSEALNLNIIVLNDMDLDINYENKLSFNTILQNPDYKYIILYFELGSHFKLIGNFDGAKMNVLFDCEPKELAELRIQNEE
jgi:hypothetical protein